jgi:hypothetical protein
MLIVPDEGHSRYVPDEGHSRYVLCALYLISTFLLLDRFFIEIFSSSKKKLSKKKPQETPHSDKGDLVTFADFGYLV